jgi:hypothetical protein
MMGLHLRNIQHLRELSFGKNGQKKMDIRSEIESWFPNIVGKKFKIFKSNEKFNCVAYSLDFYDDWIWTNEKTWPYDKIPRNSGLNGFKQLYKLNGYEECDNDKFEKGYEKMSIL